MRLSEFLVSHAIRGRDALTRLSGRWPWSGRRSRGTPRRGLIGIALILLGFIVVPSGLLGYLGWRAVENERAFSEERLRVSYRDFARLGAGEIQQALTEVESRWAAALDRAAGHPAGPNAIHQARLDDRDALIVGYVRVPSPGAPVHGPGRPARMAIRDRREFDRLATRGEELEYHERDLDGAIVAYRGILSAVSNPSLCATAMSCIGRVQLKASDWAAALRTFRRLLRAYPEARDPAGMYLRFLAQYQIAAALEGMAKEPAALDALLALNRDLLERSDAVNTLQYSYYTELIQNKAQRLMSAPNLADRARYQKAFEELQDQHKKELSERYFVQVLDTRLEESVVRHRHYSPKLRYLSDQAEGTPFLLVYRALPDPGRVYVEGLLAAQIDLAALRAQLFPRILDNLRSGGAFSLAILGAQGEHVIGIGPVVGDPIATYPLAPPFDFWQVAVYLPDVPGALRRLDLRTTLGLWLIALLLASILAGAVVFLRRARRESRLALAQTHFVSNVSHELRTPLSSIRMMAELLEMQLDGSTAPTATTQANTVQYIGIIRHESERLSRLIDNVLDFSRMEHRTRRFHLEYDNVGEVVRRAVASFRPQVESQGFSLELVIDDPLPELLIDADAIAQVMLNLMSNAAQFSDQRKEIRIHASRSGETVEIEVADRGIGIAAAELPHVFDKFYSGRRRMDSPQGGGLGLGLALARGIVAAHRGHIRVTSELGQGSTFTVTLPVAEAGTGRGAVDTTRLAGARP